MKSITLLLSVMFFSAALGQQGFLNQAEMLRISVNQKDWTPSINSNFANMSQAQLKALVSVLPPQQATLRSDIPSVTAYVPAGGPTQAFDQAFFGNSNSNLVGATASRNTTTTNTTKPSNTTTTNTTTNTSFDARTKWSSCVGAVRNQGSCGSCWAFATIESFEDRLCIAGKASPLVPRSPQYLLDCDTAESGCNGGNPNSAWSFLVKYGSPSEACYPYQGAKKACPSKCSNGSALTTTKAAAVVTYSSIAAVQADIQAKGPVETYFMVYEDFYYYQSGIYSPTTTTQVGYHAVKVIGFGVDAKVGNYWLVQNSWGTSWGQTGYFQIKAGTCEFDTLNHFVSGTV